MATALMVAGCGVSEKQLTAAEAKVKTLQEKGLPDSAITEVKVYIFQIRTANKLGQNSTARTYYDSLTSALARAEAGFSAALASFKPYVDSVVAAVGESKKPLTGMLLEPVDSVLALVDSLARTNHLLDAKKECDQLVAWMPGMLESQKKTVEMRPKFIGTWSRSEQDETGAVRKEAFTFAKDGVLKTAEEKKGLSNEAFKEDWKFVSSGTWDNIADTVYLFVTKESCERQNYSNLKIVDGKKKWVDAKGATYKDSTVAKNRFMTWEELTVGEYKKK
jgi:hypothetical protein